MSSDPRALRQVFDALGELDVAVASRYAPGAKARREPVRLVLSLAFNFLVQLVFGSRLRDHQCGLKAFRKSVVMQVVKNVESRGWFWDTEVLVFSQRLGYRVAEIPVAWSEERLHGASKVSLFDDSCSMLSDIILLRLRLC